MPSLRERQRQLLSAIAGGVDGDVHSGEAVFGPRIHVYRRNVTANYRSALSATYPVVKRLVGPIFFNALVDSYVVAVPSVSGDLNVYGDRFAEFLETYPPAQSLPYLPSVARLEWAIDEVNRAAERAVDPQQLLTQLSIVPATRLASLRIALAPSFRLLRSLYPVMHIWRTNQPDYVGDMHVDLAEGGDDVLVRRVADGVALEPVPLGEYAWLSALAQNATLDRAIDAAQQADSTFDLAAVLQRHFAAGTFVEIVED